MINISCGLTVYFVRKRLNLTLLKSEENIVPINVRHIERQKNIVAQWHETGKINIKPLRRYLLKKQANCCAECTIKIWNEKPIVLELHHIDGNSENDVEENVVMLCPNCHSQTPNFKNRNMGNGRKFRRIILNGKGPVL